VSDENLNYLSSEQALADIANFIVNMTDMHNLQQRKWIVFGGSYSGTATGIKEIFFILSINCI